MESWRINRRLTASQERRTLQAEARTYSKSTDTRNNLLSRNIMVYLGNSRYGWNAGFEIEGMVREKAGGREQETDHEWHMCNYSHHCWVPNTILLPFC